MPEREWKLGIDLGTYDNLLDGLTFDELLLTVRCNCREVTPEAVRREFTEILKMRLEDASFLLDRNVDEIVRMVREERGL